MDPLRMGMMDAELAYRRERVLADYPRRASRRQLRRLIADRRAARAAAATASVPMENVRQADLTRQA